jgi:chloramphenicol O-acetyltransferase type A
MMGDISFARVHVEIRVLGGIMREINIETWKRKKHFEVFSQFDHPHFNLCTNVDISLFLEVIKDRQLSFTISMVYLLAKTANSIPEFKHRILKDKVVEYPIVHPSTTILTDDELFSFCTIPYREDFGRFYTQAEVQIQQVKADLTLEDEPGQHNLLYMTSIPWVSFTNMLHPTHGHPADSVPRIAWGKYFKVGEKVQMPLSVQVHHALMDGIHLGKFFTQIQSMLDNTKALLDKAD